MVSEHRDGLPPARAQVEPLDEAGMSAVRDIIEMAQATGGYVPTSLRVMARKPAVLRAFAGLRDAVMQYMRDEGVGCLSANASQRTEDQ